MSKYTMKETVTTGIHEGQTPKQIIRLLGKRFPKKTLEAYKVSVKHYGQLLYTAGEITEEQRDVYNPPTPTVKSICKTNIAKGKSMDFIVKQLDKHFGTKYDEAGNIKNIKYWAGRMHSKGEIDLDLRSKYLSHTGLQPKGAKKKAFKKRVKVKK